MMFHIYWAREGILRVPCLLNVLNKLVFILRLLCEMGWIESDENDYVITDEEKREFASKTSVSGGGGGVVRGGSGGGASVGGNSTIVGGLRRFDIDSGDDDDDSLDEDEDIDELTSRYSLNRD